MARRRRSSRGSSVGMGTPMDVSPVIASRLQEGQINAALQELQDRQLADYMAQMNAVSAQRQQEMKRLDTIRELQLGMIDAGDKQDLAMQNFLLRQQKQMGQ